MVGNGPPLKKAGKFKFWYNTKYNGRIFASKLLHTYDAFVEQEKLQNRSK